MSKPAAVKVFEIPELAILVFNHLRKRDLVACALVHSAWHKAAIPLIYHSITIDSTSRFFGRTLDEDFWDGLKKYSRYIRLLKVYSSSIGDISSLGFSCISLTDLHLNIYDDGSTNVLWSWGLLKLISNNPGISSLVIRPSYDSPASLVTLDHHVVVLGLLRYMPRLKKLLITGTCPANSAPGLFWDGPSLVSLKDHDNDDITHDGPYIPDSQGRRCRQGASLKKFFLSLGTSYHRYVHSDDASVLAHHCCSAEDIQLFIMEETTRKKIMQALEDQVDHPAWCLKHLTIGYILPKDTSIMVKILSAKSSSLVSLWLWDCYFSDELLSVLLQNHGKTLQRMTMGKCKELHKADIEALLSGYSSLRSLGVFNAEEYGDLGTGLPKECQLRWTGPDGRIIKVFMSDEAYWTAEFKTHPTIEEEVAIAEEGSIPDDPWRQLQLMERDVIKSHVRFLAK